MTIRVIRQFYDKSENLKLRKIGDEINVTKERGKYLIKNKYAVEVTAKKK